MILSCSEPHARRIRDLGKQHLSNVAWTLLYRYDPTGVFKNERVIISSDAMSLLKKLQMLKQIRAQKFDVVYIARTQEPTFTLLKVLGLLSNFNYLKLCDETAGGFYLLRSNFFKFLPRLRWRWQYPRRFIRLIANLLSWVILFPLGFIYVVLRTIQFWFIKSFHSKSQPLDN
ncbi:MAG TPA: hypothetical protein VFF29_06515 [Bacteroidota bacterium]|nr:hypothetical protein [Bacteroidota bacterium]